MYIYHRSPAPPLSLKSITLKICDNMDFGTFHRTTQL